MKDEELKDKVEEKKSSQVSNSMRIKEQQDAHLQEIIAKNKAREQLIEASIQMEEASQLEEQKEESQNDTKSTNIIKNFGGNISASTISDAEASPELKKELSSIIMKKLLTKKVLIALGISIFMVIFIILIFTIFNSLKNDESEINTSPELIDVIKGDKNIDEIVSYLVYLGVCRDLVDDSEEVKQCVNSGFGRFLMEFNSTYKSYLNYKNKYDEPVELDIPLLLETISYNRSDDDLNALLETTSGFSKVKTELNNLSEALVEHIQEFGDYYSYSGGKCTVKKDVLIGNAYYRISDEKYVSYLKYGKVHENYKGKVRLYDAVLHPQSVEKCIPEGLYYSPPSEERYVGKEIAEYNKNPDDDSDNENIPIPSSGAGAEVVKYALQFVGNPYVWGGTSLINGADCSGFTMKVFEHFGITLPHHSLSQANYGKNIGTNIKNALPGDLIVYNHAHVAIYIGNNKIVHAASKKTGIKVGNKADYKSIFSIRRLVE